MLQNEIPHLESEISDSFSIKLLSGTSTGKPQRLNYHRIMLVERGAGSLQIDDKIYLLDENQLFLIAKGQVFSSDSDATISGMEISFGDCFWERAPASANNCKAVLFNNASDNQYLPLEKDGMNALFPLFTSLHSEYLQPAYINKLDAMAAFLKIIMIKVANINALLTQGYDNSEKQLYRKFLELVSRDYHSRHEVSDYSKQMNITSRKLSQLCKRCSGRGAKEIINGQLIAEAKRSLQFTASSVKEIAYQLNFATPEQFSHFFRKNVLASPSEYRSSFMAFGH